MSSAVYRAAAVRISDWRGLTILLVAFLLGNLIALLLYAPVDRREPMQHRPYEYYATHAGNGVKLHAVRTVPEQIELKPIASNVTKTTDYGMNGGFFWEGYLLSIAVRNDQPVKGKPEDYGSGWHNIDVPKGTLVWDETARRYSVQVVLDAGELQVTDKQHYWAQGGVSMGLQSSLGWREQARRENMPVMDEPRLRSGIVYDAMQQVWLIVSDKPCTVEQFRSAILETIMPGRLVDGVFLDGDGSSQLKLEEVQLKGDSRPVYQMIALKPVS
jgi:hypothetical protein